MRVVHEVVDGVVRIAAAARGTVVNRLLLRRRVADQVPIRVASRMGARRVFREALAVVERVQKAEVMPHLVRCSRALVIGPRGGAWAPDGGPYGDAIDTTSRILCQICLSEYAAGRRLDKNVHAVVDIRS